MNTLFSSFLPLNPPSQIQSTFYLNMRISTRFFILNIFFEINIITSFPLLFSTSKLSQVPPSLLSQIPGLSIFVSLFVLFYICVCARTHA